GVVLHHHHAHRGPSHHCGRHKRRTESGRTSATSTGHLRGAACPGRVSGFEVRDSFEAGTALASRAHTERGVSCRNPTSRLRFEKLGTGIAHHASRFGARRRSLRLILPLTHGEGAFGEGGSVRDPIVSPS